jgi:hypothetical protein
MAHSEFENGWIPSGPALWTSYRLPRPRFISDKLRERFVEDAPEGYGAVLEVRFLLGVSRQTVLQRVKLGELDR